MDINMKTIIDSAKESVRFWHATALEHHKMANVAHGGHTDHDAHVFRWEARMCWDCVRRYEEAVENLTAVLCCARMADTTAN